MLRRQSLLALALVSAVAASASAQPKELIALKGQPVQPVIDKLGAPESEDKTASGATTYGWTVKSMVDMPTRVTRTDYASGRPNTYETTEMRRQLTPCTLRLTVDASGTIGDVQADGQFPACAAIVDKLQGRN